MIKETPWLTNRYGLFEQSGKWDSIAICAEVVDEKFIVPPDVRIKLRLSIRKFEESIPVYLKIMRNETTGAFWSRASTARQCPLYELQDWVQANFKIKSTGRTRLYWGIAYEEN